jgi:hypothetical protein
MHRLPHQLVAHGVNDITTIGNGGSFAVGRICLMESINHPRGIEPIEPPLRGWARRLGARVVDPPRDFRQEWLSEQRWKVVAAPSASHFSRRNADALVLSRAISGTVASRVVADTTEGWKVPPYWVVASESGLVQLSDELHWAECSLIDPRRQMCVICTAYDFLLIGGSQSFVEAAVGCDLQSAWRNFLQEARQPNNHRQSGYLESVASRYMPTCGLQ